jgi:hypothetical protein
MMCTEPINGDCCMHRRVIALNLAVMYIVCNAACDPQVAPKLRHELEQAAAAASKVRPAMTAGTTAQPVIVGC